MDVNELFIDIHDGNIFFNDIALKFSVSWVCFGLLNDNLLVNALYNRCCNWKYFKNFIFVNAHTR